MDVRFIAYNKNPDNNNTHTPLCPDFAAGLNSLLDAIEGAYGGPAHNTTGVLPLAIIVTCGPFDFCCFNSTQEAVVTARGDPAVTFVSMDGVLPNTADPGPYIGCDGHPDSEGDVFMTKALYAAVARQPQ